MASVSLFIVLFAALLIPLFMARFRITSTPTAVAEIVVGMLLGPSLFNVVNPGGTLSELSDLGVVVLLFLSGMEIDFSLFKRGSGTAKWGPAKLAILGYAGIVGVALLLSYALKLVGLFSHFGFTTIVFITVALGVVIATLKEKELLSKPFGQTMLLLAAFGEVIPLIALTVYAATHGTTHQSVWLLLLIFVAAIVLLLWTAGRFRFSPASIKAPRSSTFASRFS